MIACDDKFKDRLEFRSTALPAPNPRIKMDIRRPNALSYEP
jgi:hypothetical protein